MRQLGLFLGVATFMGTLLQAAPVVYWNGERVTSAEALGAIAYNQSVSIAVTFDTADVPSGTLVEVKGGGGNDSVSNVHKRLAVTVENGALNAIVAGKNGTDVTLGDSALLTTLPKGMVRVAMVIETSTGTSIEPRAIATGGSQRSGSDFNFDNAAGSSWSANAPFDTWMVADEVLLVEVETSAWSTAEMAQKVNAPLRFWNGELVPSFAGRQVAYNESFSMAVRFDPALVQSGTLVEVKGGGGNTTVQNVQKRVAVTLENGQLCGMVAGKDGNSIMVGDAPLLTTLPTGEVRAAMAVANTTSGTSVTVRSQATGGLMRSKERFKFDNVAGTQWSANAPFNTWTVAQGVTAVEVVTGVAWNEAALAEKVTLPSEEEALGRVLEVVGTVTYPEEAPDKVRFKGGTLVIPQGMTVETLRLTADSGDGMLVVRGALVGRDSAEPHIPAFELPPTIVLDDGGMLQMDGRITSAVTLSGAVTLSAATAGGTLTLDTITVEEGARVTIPQGCLEVYACPKLEASEGAAFRRWVAPGFQVRIF